MTLSEKMERWGQLQRVADALAEEIEAEVMELQQTVTSETVCATYGSGRSSYDYESLAMHLEPDEDVIEANSSIRVDWRKVCVATGYTDEQLAAVKKEGRPYVSLRLEK